VLQVVRCLLHRLLQERRRGGQVCSDDGLVEVLTALGHGGNEGDTEAAAPVAEEVGER